MTAALHQFPGSNPGENKKPLSLRPPIVFESFEEDHARALLDVAQQRLAGAQTLLAFIDTNRELARHAGIETIGIELVAFTEGDRFSRVIDALEDAVENGGKAQISTDGLAILRRVETLLAEASANIRRFTEGGSLPTDLLEVKAGSGELFMNGVNGKTVSRQAPALAAARVPWLGQAKGTDFPTWVPMAIFGAIVLATAVIAVIAASVKK